MKPKLLIIFLVLVLTPLGLLVGLGVRVARDERALVRQQMEMLLRGKLADVDATIAAFLDERRRQVAQATEVADHDPETLRGIARHNGFIRQVFLLAADGRLLYPPPNGPRTEAETEFLLRTLRIWRDGALLRPPAAEDAAPPPTPKDAQNLPQQQDRQSVQQVAPVRRTPSEDAWFAWYWDDGLHLLCRRRVDSGEIIGAELDGVRLLSDIVGRLPHTDPLDPSLPDGRVALSDSGGAAVYVWGMYEPRPGEAPQAALALSPPLQSWKLQYYASHAEIDRALGRGLLVNLAAAALVAAVALIGLGVYFYRESTRELREAAQRVTFVNQVSHELKTPLTNIRMYAELLQERIESGDEEARRHLDVIVGESQRLSRLINNVLTFARGQRRKLTLRPRPRVPRRHGAAG